MSELITAYPWFESVSDHLCSLQQQQRLPHALLLHGKSGIGKARFAHSFAQYLLCQSDENNSACGHCKPCELNAAGTHPDLFILEPEEEGKQLKVDQVRALGEFIYSTAQQGGYRIVIINPADAMNTASANALLKMLEEPGSDTFIFLVTSKAGQMLPTIKSRCQQIECHAPSEDVAVQWLVQQSEIDTETAQQILSINRGAPNQALTYIEQNIAENRALFIRGLADVLKQRRSAFEVAQSWSKEDLERILGWFYSLLLDITRLSSCKEGVMIRQNDAQNMLIAVAKKVDPVRIFKLADRVQLERKSILLRQNPNKQLLLESVLLEWAALFR